MTETPVMSTYPMAKEPGCPMDPPARYASLRVEAPVSRTRLWDGNEAWLVTRQEDIRKILSDSSASVDVAHPNFPWLSEMSKALNLTDDGVRPFGRLDPPEHTEIRRMLSPHFLLKKVRGLRPGIEKLVDGLIDRMLEGDRPVDLVQALAEPVPSTVVGWLLGLPEESMDGFVDNVAKLFDEDATVDTMLAARNNLFGQLQQLAALRRKEPDGNIVSRMVGFVDDGKLSEMEMLMHVGVILAAGYTTVAKMISTGVLALLSHPGQAELLVADPSRAGAAVEELLRYLTVAEFAPKRVAVADIELGGQTIKAGDGIICLISSANRDETLFDHADVLDIERDASGHLAFGSGIHLCIGHNIARVELEVVFERLFRRLPGLRCSLPLDEVAFSGGVDIQGVKSLPVTW